MTSALSVFVFWKHCDIQLKGRKAQNCNLLQSMENAFTAYAFGSGL